MLDGWFAANNLIPNGDKTSRIVFSLTRNAQKPVGSKVHKLIEITIDKHFLKIAKCFFFRMSNPYSISFKARIIE